VAQSKTSSKTSAGSAKKKQVHIALLRGINVGGKNQLPMKALAEMFATLGCSNVSTYIQSGNVVCEAHDVLAPKLPKAIEKAIGESYGYRIPIVMRTRDELVRVTTDNPFLLAGADPSKLFVMFLADAPSAERIASLDPKRSPGDEFAIRGRDLYLFLPNGVGSSKITNAYLDSKLGTVSTGRNWRTVLKLAELSAR
jgi:uncharacterized protein (DUF1697 family)